MNQLSDELAKLARSTQSIILTTTDDNQQWECSIIANGKRFTSFSEIQWPALAVFNARKQAEDYAATKMKDVNRG